MIATVCTALRKVLRIGILGHCSSQLLGTCSRYSLTLVPKIKRGEGQHQHIIITALRKVLRIAF